VGDALNALGINALKASKMTDAEILQAMEKAAVEKTAAAEAVANEKKMMQMRDALLNMLDDLRKQFGPTMKLALDQFMNGLKTFTGIIDNYGDIIGKVLAQLTAIWLAWKAVSGVASVVTVVRTLAGPTAAGGAAGAAGAGAAGAGAAGVGQGAGRGMIGLARGIKAFASPQVALGAIGFGFAIAAIGAGIAGAAWLTGKALPTLAEGLTKMAEIDGARLGNVAYGTLKLGGALVTFAPFAVYGWAAGMAMNSLADGIVKLNAVDPVKLEKVAMAMQKVKDATPTLGESIKAGVSNIIGKITGTANITSTATPPPTNAVTYAPGPVETPIKNLQVDIRELHTTMREVLKYVKETAEHARSNVTATRALNSNGFPTTS
jgi:hypothetical protein